MRYCQSCNGEIEGSRRKDARFCKKPGCRAKDFRRRKRQQAAEHPINQTQKPNESVIVTCSCGNRLLVQVTHLGPAEQPSSGGSDLSAGTELGATPTMTEPTPHPASAFLAKPSPSSPAHVPVTEVSVENSRVKIDDAITQVATLPAAVCEDPQPQEQSSHGLSESTAVTRTVPNVASTVGIVPEAPPELEPGPVQSVAPNGSSPSLPTNDVVEAEMQAYPPALQAKAIAVTRTVTDSASTVTTAPEARTQLEAPTAKPAHGAAPNGSIAGVPENQPMATEAKSHPIPTPRVSSPTSSQETPSISMPGSPPPGPASLVRWTCELAGSVRGRRLLPLSAAIQRYRDGSIGLMPGMELYLCRTPAEGQMISGSPGCWRELYPDNSPADFGQDSDLAVVGWDAPAGRAYVIHTDLLRQLLGNDWRGQLRDAVRRLR